MNKHDPSDESHKLWDDAASTFDDEPDHGLRDAAVRQAWLDLLKRALPDPPAAVLDVGCGTGSLSLLLAEAGYQVTGIDFSPAMIAQAAAKASAATQAITLQRMDAAFPEFPPRQFDVVLCRHLLWALPEPADVLSRWVDLLKPDGRLLLIEGLWATGAGLPAPVLQAMLPAELTDVAIQNLGNQPALWGKVVTDARYIITARRA